MLTTLAMMWHLLLLLHGNMALSWIRGTDIVKIQCLYYKYIRKKNFPFLSLSKNQVNNVSNLLLHNITSNNDTSFLTRNWCWLGVYKVTSFSKYLIIIVWIQCTINKEFKMKHFIAVLVCALFVAVSVSDF